MASLSIIVPAHNEAALIRNRIANVLSQGELVHEVIIGSDGSDDETAAIARRYPDARVKVLEFPDRRGRALVCNDCVAAATGQIVVLTDADTQFKPEFLREIVRPFGDPSVAVAVGKLLWRSPGSEGAGVYWSMELALRSLESDLSLLATASGPCMAVRRSCYEPLLADEDPDFSTPIQVVRKGFRVVYAPTAVGHRCRSPVGSRGIPGALEDGHQEFCRHVAGTGPDQPTQASRDSGGRFSRTSCCGGSARFS